MTHPEDNGASIVDTHIKQAGEALRVIERYGRFVLHDAGLTRAAEGIAHALDACGRAEFGRTLATFRETAPQVPGRGTTAPKSSHTGLSQEATGAVQQLLDALAVVEASRQSVDPTFAAEVGEIRRRAEELRERLSRTLVARERFGHVRLYVLLTESLCHGDWFATARAALEGGADCLQLREKQLTDQELVDRAKRLASLCRNFGALLIVNDRPDLAVQSGADGVHVGQDDLSVAQVRRIVAPTSLVGVSTHTPEQFTAAAAMAPDYIAVGPMFATSTKPQDHIAGPETLAAARRHTSLPLVAIGGIDAQNAREVLSAARCCLCVCGAVISQADVTAAVTRLRACIDEFRPESIPQDAPESQPEG